MAERGRGIRVERVELTALRGGPVAARHAAAERIFRCWQPLFPHLANADPSFHLRKHVDDARPSRLVALFVIDGDGRDRGLVIVRFTPVELAGRACTVYTFHAGLHPPWRTADLWVPYLRETARFLARHPRRPLYFAELLSHPAVYLTARRGFPRLRPGPGAPLAPSMRPLVAAVAAVHGATPLGDDAPVGVCHDALGTAMSEYERAQFAERARHDPAVRWFLDTAVAGRGVVVAAPMGPAELAWSAARFVAFRAGRRLGLLRRSPREAAS